MGSAMTNVVRIGKEVSRGTAVAGTLTVPYVGDGLKIGLTNHVAKIRASSTFPQLTDQVSVGLTPAVRLTPDVNLATIRDLILMAFMRTAGVLPSLTIEESGYGIAMQKAAGCVCNSLALSFSRSETPDAAALLAAQMQFAAMSVASATGVSAGTYGVGHRFAIAQGTYTINSVATITPVQFSWTHTNALKAGAHTSARAIEWIDDGEAEDVFELTGRFTTAAWRDLVAAATDHAATFVLATGTATETVTIALAKCQMESHELSDDGPTVMQAIRMTPCQSGATAPVVLTFGAGIGASALGLS